MDVIPVIDLMGGEVVHARRGDRGAYRPIHSPLVESSRPQAVAAALLALAPFRRLYVADLDAIRGTGGHDAVIAELADAHPQLEIWVDRGESDPATLRLRAKIGPGVSVIGSESFSHGDALRSACQASAGVLSLDHDASGPIGPTDAHEDSSFWPDRVIVMTLARVGADAGPDLDRLEGVLSLAGARRVYAAGGVRGADDLTALANLGVSGALVASALHDGRLSRELLEQALRAGPRTAPRP
ncbi:HisA/HisF-related TIM barrel protein [Hansschlegelia sp.]|uniref:HisA/HisF-related TIM barrel protein n=1 Tax=Hansschlegelia sp. TaxID=2041892 RepID=UPI002CFDF8A1|nr:HisA/HisF-related TIM barrel protein [Hansschlegelia sp.]HVI29215.1 HisA/HisF-related TIM barrel protein [Hansschlegelia sp.]